MAIRRCALSNPTREANRGKTAHVKHRARNRHQRFGARDPAGEQRHDPHVHGGVNRDEDDHQQRPLRDEQREPDVRSAGEQAFDDAPGRRDLAVQSNLCEFLLGLQRLGVRSRRMSASRTNPTCMP